MMRYVLLHRLLLLLLLVCMPASATVNAKDYGAQGNGVDDDTAQLKEALAAACARVEGLYIPAGTYLVKGINTLNGCGISISGEGAELTTIKLNASLTGPMWAFSGDPAGASILTIEDLTLDGGHLGGAGLAIEKYRLVAVHRVFIHDFGTPGYSLGHHEPYDGLYIRNVETVRVTDSRFTGNERYGIEMQAVHNSLVSTSTMSFNGGMGGVSEQNFDGPLDGPLLAQWLDNTLIGNGSGGIDVETDPVLPPAQGILQGNQVIDCGNDRWDSGWGLVLGVHSFGTIQRNWVRDFAAYAISSEYADAIVYAKNAGPINIANNTILGTKARAILGANSSFPVSITGNTLTDNGTGIFIYKSQGVFITKNTVTDSDGPGITVLLSRASRIIDNRLARNLRSLKTNGRFEKEISLRAPLSPH